MALTHNSSILVSSSSTVEEGFRLWLSRLVWRVFGQHCHSSPEILSAVYSFGSRVLVL